MVKAVLVSTMLALGVTASVSATPFVLPARCGTNTLDNYLLPGPGGCSVGEVAFSALDFNVLSAGRGAVPLSRAI